MDEKNRRSGRAMEVARNADAADGDADFFHVKRIRKAGGWAMKGDRGCRGSPGAAREAGLWIVLRRETWPGSLFAVTNGSKYSNNALQA